MELDSSSLDAMQTMASFRLSQQKKEEEAIEFMGRVYQAMQTGCVALASLVGMTSSTEASRELIQVEEAQSLPSFSFRCQTAKLLLECAKLLEKASGAEKANDYREASICVLASLLAEQDEVVEVWYLLGCAHGALGQVEEAASYLERAQEMLMAVLPTLRQEGEDPDELEEAETQLNLVQSQIQSLGLMPEEQKKKNEDGDDQMDCL